MNRADIRNHIKKHGVGDLEYPDSSINAVINMAYGDIQIDGNLPFTEAGPTTLTVAANVSGALAEVSLPGNFNKVRMITHGGNKLRYLSPNDFIQTRLYGDDTAAPQYYTIYAGSRLLIHPVNEAIINIVLWYNKVLAPLSGDSDIPAIPERYHDLIVTAALKRIYSALDDDEKSQYYNQLYEAEMEKCRNDVSVVEYDNLESIGSVYSLDSMAKMVREHGYKKIGDSMVRLFINQTIREISSMANWSWLESEATISISGAAASLPVDCHKIRAIVVSEAGKDFKLEYVPADDVWEEARDKTGNPEQYSIWGGLTNLGAQQIRVYPRPVAAVSATVYYLRKPELVVNPTDSPEIPAQHHSVVMLGVLHKCALAATEDAGLAKMSIYKTEYIEAVQSLYDDAMGRTLDTPLAIKNVRDF